MHHHATCKPHAADPVGLDTGLITPLAALQALKQELTTFQTDNVGLNPHLISKSAIANVVEAFPRKQWTSCFGEAMVREIELKPWCHTTANEGFIEAILGNELMEPFDE